VSDEEAAAIVVFRGTEDGFRVTNAGRFTEDVVRRDPKIGMLRHYCGFFDLETRLCTVYSVRPQLCRDFEHEV
jgi:Fe-S-cluster containining protein